MNSRKNAFNRRPMSQAPADPQNSPVPIPGPQATGRDDAAADAQPPDLALLNGIWDGATGAASYAPRAASESRAIRGQSARLALPGAAGDPGSPDIAALPPKRPDRALPPAPSIEPDSRRAAAAIPAFRRTTAGTLLRPLGSFQAAAWIVGLLVLAAVIIGVYATRKPVRTPSVGTLIVSSAPEGAEATIDGVARGTTPLQITLPPGAHLLGLKVGARQVSVPVSVDAGVKASQHIEFAPSETPKTGALEVTSTPPGDEVRVDGQRRGKTPLKMSDLAVGAHTIAVGQGAAAVTRTVSIAAGATASVVTARREPADPVPAGGWVAFKTPIDLKIYENGRLIGVSGMDRLALSSGAHSIDVANDALEFRTAVRVNVTAGKLSTVNVPVPNGSVSLNATPWAEVTIDGRPIGTTPVANVPVPIGRHEVVWKHPQRGERRQEFTVTAAAPLRLAVDLTK